MLRRNHLLKALSLGRKGDEWEFGGTMAEPATEPVPSPRPRPRPGGRMTAVAFFTVIFFAGASFTAVAGDQAATLLEDYDAAEAPLAPEDELAGEEGLAPAGEAAAEEAPAAEVEPAAEEGAAAPEAAAPLEPTAPEEPAVAPELAHELEEEEEAAAASQTEPLAPLVPAAPELAPAAPEPAAAEPAAPVAAAAAARASAKAHASHQHVHGHEPAADEGPAASKKQRNWVATRAQTPPAREPEVDHGESLGEPTVWLNRALPDPTPRSKRLKPRFAKELRAAARRHDADWAAVLGILRAQGARGAAPATVAELDVLAARLSGRDTWRAALALSGRTEFADRAEALRDYYKAVGLKTLVQGLKASKERLVKRLLKDERVWIYWGGQSDLEADRIDVRIVVLIAYLAERHDSVTVSSLFSGHRKYSRPGVISAHTYGQAVDIAAVGGASILGNSQPGGLTEDAVRSVLLLPAELQPQQVISLLGLGGPSFPLSDHGDHIHVGY
jgi:hypothetical protein